MAAVITTTMTLRIILSVRGTLYSGGTFAGAISSGSSNSNSHVIGSLRPIGSSVHQMASQLRSAQTYTIDGLNPKSQGTWDNKSSVQDIAEAKEATTLDEDQRLSTRDPVSAPGLGVRVTVNREVVAITQ